MKTMPAMAPKPMPKPKLSAVAPCNQRRLLCSATTLAGVSSGWYCFGQDRLDGCPKRGRLPVDSLALVEGLAVTGGAGVGGDGKLMAADQLSISR